MLSAAIDLAGTNIFFASADFDLIYMNRKARETMKGMEAITRELFGVSTDQIVGGSIDRFHKGELRPRVRAILSDRRNLPYRRVIAVGARKLDLCVAGIPEGNDIAGYIVNWEDVTDREQFAAQSQRLQNMMDNVPINVMLCDRDLTLLYMNPASTAMFRRLEHLLPVKVDKMIGQKIDIFHKRPEHQRKLLGTEKNLPFRTKITLGSETLDLNVDAVFEKGVYVGAMATWSIVTDRVQLADEFERNVASVVGIVSASASELEANATSMAASAEETTAQAKTVAAASDQATQNVHTVAASTEELTASIREIAVRVQEASLIAQEAVRAASTTTDTMAKLGRSSQEIGHVVKVITSIARQTNLLALNATIEAARAGDAGKGFAVVASEVKELARQTARATEEISGKIGGVQADTTGAIKAIDAITKIINQISEISLAIATAVEEQDAATAEIARNVAEAARGTAEVTSNISAVTQVAQESGHTAESIKAASTQLAVEADRLSHQVAEFLKRTRAF